MTRWSDNSPLSKALVESRREDSIAKAIQNLVHEVRLKTDQFDIPVVPERIAELLGATVERVYLEAEGVLEEDNPEGPKILVPRRASTKTEALRRRFTIAHELGHLVLRRELRDMVPADLFEDPNPEEERLCNMFAEELLMPVEALRPQLLLHGTSPLELLRISENYRVSVQSLATRTARIWPKSQGDYWAIIWRKDRGQIVARWSYPGHLTEATLCDTGTTSVEKAFDLRSEQSGRVKLRFNGKNVSVMTRACGLNSPTLVLMLALRRTPNEPSHSPPYRQR